MKQRIAELEKRIKNLEEIVRLQNVQIGRLYAATQGNLKSVEALAALAGLKLDTPELPPTMTN